MNEDQQSEKTKGNEEKNAQVEGILNTKQCLSVIILL